jgi:hypothetical protein
MRCGTKVLLLHLQQSEVVLLHVLEIFASACCLSGWPVCRVREVLVIAEIRQDVVAEADVVVLLPADGISEACFLRPVPLVYARGECRSKRALRTCS